MSRVRGSLTATPADSMPPTMNYSDGARNSDG